MGRRDDHAFILGAEPLDVGSNESLEQPAGEPERRDAFRPSPERGEGSAAAAPGPVRSSAFLPTALALAAGAAVLLFALSRGGGGDPSAVEHRPASPAEPEATVAPSPALRSAGRGDRLPPRRAAQGSQQRRPASRFKPNKPHHRQSGRPQRDPTSEPAPQAAPIDEPAPAPVSGPGPVSPPLSPSPPPASGGGPGGRPEFSFER